MTFYYQYANNDQYNKIYQQALPSGQGLAPIPYTFGYFNKLNPKPFGLPIPAQFYHRLADSGYRENKNVASPAESVLPTAVFGPVNYIYEADISGIQTYPGKSGCLDCSYLNRKYYFYLSSDTIFGTPIIGIGNRGNVATWTTALCNSSQRFGDCGFNFPTLQLKSFTNGGLFSVASGLAWELTFLQLGNVRGEASNLGGLPGVGEGSQTFKKVFDYFLFDPSTNGNANLNQRKVKALEEEWILPYYTGVSQTFGSLSDVNYRSSGDFNCNFSQATVILKPYKNDFYDIYNVSEYTRTQSSGYPINILADDGLILPPTHPFAFRNVNSFCKPSPLISGYSDLEYTSLPDIGKFPASLRINFFGVQDIIARENCVPCSTFFGSSFLLNRKTTLLNAAIAAPADNSGTIGSHIYEWIGFASLPQYNNFDTDYNFMNLCDLGCTTSKVFGVNDGPCFNSIQLGFFADSTTISGVVNIKWDAVISFFGKNTNSERVSAFSFTKNICNDQVSGIACTSGVGLSRRGRIDCGNQEFWSSGWMYVPTNSGTNIISVPERDVTLYCNFSNSVPVITPIIDWHTTCSYPMCIPCNKTDVAKSANVSLRIVESGTIEWYSADYILSLGAKSCAAGNVQAFGACCWAFDDTSESGNFGSKLDLAVGPVGNAGTASGIIYHMGIFLGSGVITSIFGPGYSVGGSFCDISYIACPFGYRTNIGNGIGLWATQCPETVSISGGATIVKMSGFTALDTKAVSFMVDVELTDLQPISSYF